MTESAPSRAASLIVIVGPTGSGKSEWALDLAEGLGGAIVSCDSQQVYRGMDIGTGKLPVEDRRGIPHYMIDVCEPTEEMTAADFVRQADAAIVEIESAGKVAILAGGTMLYVRALLFGLFEGPGADEDLRERLRSKARAQGCDSLWRELEKVDAASAARIHGTDERRLIRALEVFELTGTPLSEHHRRHQNQEPRYRHKMWGLAWPRETLYRRIDRRVEGMLADGWIDEVRGLRERGCDRETRSQRAIGYSEIHRFLDGNLEEGEMLRLVQRNSRRYARRQLSWYRGQEKLEWADPELRHSVDLTHFERYLRGPS